jgi:hypothetical protein
MLASRAQGGHFRQIQRETIEGLFGVYLHSTGVWAISSFLRPRKHMGSNERVRIPCISVDST